MEEGKTSEIKKEHLTKKNSRRLRQRMDFNPPPNPMTHHKLWYHDLYAVDNSKVPARPPSAT